MEFLLACEGKNNLNIPIWFMRQSGRYLSEYMKIRQKYNILDICKKPELSAKLTLLPFKYFDLSCAILFSDIMIIVEPMGFEIEIKEDIGPIINNPIKSIKDVEKIKIFNVSEKLNFIKDEIKLIKEDIKKPLIGFAGGPWTIASYLVEGKPSKNYQLIKSFIHTDAYPLLMNSLLKVVSEFVKFQIESGIDAIQIFDSWAGYLDFYDYKNFVFPYVEKLFLELENYKMPKIYFGTINNHLISILNKLKIEVISFDWRIKLSDAFNMTSKSIQGNLDPIYLTLESKVLEKKVIEILNDIRDKKRYIFNTGSGILPTTKIENIQKLIELVRNYERNYQG